MLNLPRYRILTGGVLFGLVLAAMGVAAFSTGNNLLFLIFSAMLAMLLVSGFVGRLMLAGLELELLVPEHICARVPTPARVRLRNLKRLTPSFSITLAGQGITPVYFAQLPGGAMLEAAVSISFERRGLHRQNLCSVSTSFPFGFIRRTVAIALRRETLVYPAMRETARIEQLPEDGDGGTKGSGFDFYRIRPYVSGDSARFVDWKSTAHAGELQVREFAREDRRSVEIHLNRSDHARFEQSLEECAWLAWQLSEEGFEIVFRSQDCELSDVYAILRYLAVAEPSTRGNFHAGHAEGRQIIRLP